MVSCINLKERFGQPYRVAYEQDHHAEGGDVRPSSNPWLMMIPCRHGHIYPHGGDFLAAATHHRGPVAARLAALPCVDVVQDGDDGVNVQFNVAQFDEVARIMRPRRRRRLTPEQRQTRVERLRKYQFRPAIRDADGERKRVPTVRHGSPASL